MANNDEILEPAGYVRQLEADELTPDELRDLVGELVDHLGLVITTEELRDKAGYTKGRCVRLGRPADVRGW